MLFTLAASFVVAGGCRTTGRHPAQQPPGGQGQVGDSIRAIWVTRWDYKSPADIARIMDNCRGAGFNTILFQVRGNGTAFYRSNLEPWADELGGRDPGFDPLAVACREAHRRGLSLHAWVNVIPGWRGKKPPANRQQLYHAHPDWFWQDASGRRQPLGWYVSLNPAYPEVRGYLVAVMREIVSRYAIDGLHMDYIRFPNEWTTAYPRGSRVPDYPRDRRTLALFKRATGHTPDSAPHIWDRWRGDQITQVVRDIRAMIKRVNPAVRLSAAVGVKPAEAKRSHYQDVRTWLAGGLLDAVYPMNYAEDMGTFTARLGEWSAMPTRIPVVVGLMFDQRDGPTVMQQLRRTHQRGLPFAAFAYNSLFERVDGRGQTAKDKGSAARSALRKQIIPELRRLTARPPARRGKGWA